MAKKTSSFLNKKAAKTSPYASKKEDNGTDGAATDIVEGVKALAFKKINYILLAIGMAIVMLGFILMSGKASTTEAYNPDIFSPLRIKIAPIVCLFGFFFIIAAILYHKKDVVATDKPQATTAKEESEATTAQNVEDAIVSHP